MESLTPLGAVLFGIIIGLQGIVAHRVLRLTARMDQAIARHDRAEADRAGR